MGTLVDWFEGKGEGPGAELPAALKAHHLLNSAFTFFGDCLFLLDAIGTVFTNLFLLCADLDGL